MYESLLPPAPNIFTLRAEPAGVFQPLINIQEVVFDNPLALAALTLVMILGVHYQRGLSFREYRALQRGKNAVFPALDSWARSNGHFLVRTKGREGPESPEHLSTTPASPREVYRELRDAGFSPHLLASAKRRPHPAGEGWQYAWAQLIYNHPEVTGQTEVYLFRQPGGGTAIYAHNETSVTDPEGHLRDEQVDGDPLGTVPASLNEGEE